MAALVGLLMASCAGSVGSPGNAAEPIITPVASFPPTSSAGVADVYLPTYPSMEAVPEAQIGGLLVVEDGCLWIETSEGRALPLWPSGSALHRDGATLVVVNSGNARATVGTEVIGGGGEYRPEHYGFVVQLIGEEVPEPCRGDDVYWLVYDVRAARD